MKKAIFLFLVLASGIPSKAQNMEKKGFIKTEWFIDSPTINFQKSDTLTLRKMINCFSNMKNLSKEHIQMSYFDKGKKEYELSFLSFGKHKNLYLNQTTTKLCGISEIYGNWKWEFDENNQIITFESDKNEKFLYKIVENKFNYNVWKTAKFYNTETILSADITTLKLKKVEEHY